VALDPHPAAKDTDVTHPHVQEEQLCEGDGRSAVRAALAEGRLYDFFLLVSQLLHTYGRGSAYVELDHWDGIPCDDCNALTDADDRYYCDRCGNTLCSSCSITCHGCDNGFCSGCASSCDSCGLDFCSSCLQICSVCRRQFCEDCLEAGLCHSCHEKQHKEETKNASPQNHPRQRPAGRPQAGRRRRTACASA
jgi:hypothetical protein